MSEKSLIFYSWWTPGFCPGLGVTVWSFTAFGECGLSLSLGLRPVKTHSLNQEM